MSSHETKNKENDSLVRRGFRSLSFRSSKHKKKSPTHDSVDGRHGRHRHSASELTNNNSNSNNKQSPVHLGIALFPFTALLACDLSFKVGDRIDILTQTENRYDWWEGRLNGHTGIFPANYVKVLR